jgi:hypothetical protein
MDKLIDGYVDQLTTYVDLLGFTAASSRMDLEQNLRILKLLGEISELESNFEGNLVESNGGFSYNPSPSVTAFSDNIVISYKLNQPDLSLPPVQRALKSFLIYRASAIVSQVAYKAILRGFLIRGGMSIGKLYHNDGIVFGNAMVEAYMIESTLSNYPRIVVSKDVVSLAAKSNDIRMAVMQDKDGLFHLDYFIEMILPNANLKKLDPAPVRDRLREILDAVADGINKCKKSGNQKHLSKWIWFAKSFRQSLESRPDIMKGAEINLASFLWPE